MAFTIEVLSAAHDRTGFSCGTFVLDRHLREQATQDMKRRAALCYGACAEGAKAVAGFYTLSAGDVALKDTPEDLARRLPRYPVVRVARIGRLAVDQAFQGRKLGATLLWDAAERALRAETGVYALAVDAKDEGATAFSPASASLPSATGRSSSSCRWRPLPKPGRRGCNGERAAGSPCQDGVYDTHILARVERVSPSSVIRFGMPRTHRLGAIPRSSRICCSLRVEVVDGGSSRSGSAPLPDLQRPSRPN
ncbi:GNAT family N-acetyltransferase [Xanthobacter autotrophicus]|uniref:GNAT family N-acetyltransferase n=1 Tax=Xanthobacter TaxID=279 RepID=UPI0024AAD783|nr:GNAT family N-acetyltransferase [Xanthobacter autotrophicus]MDI4664737.1 GNAT family N-acetyltransferase [Xanthobacter autotrophicus]